MKRVLALLCALVVGTGYATTADHPDSVTQPLQDGCNRSQLLLLGEAFPALAHEGGPVVFPEWTYVVDPAHPDEVRAIRTLTGQVLATHTAGQDLFGNHRTYDLNVDVAPDSKYRGLLSTRNERESPAQIHTEWESGLVPLWAWPSATDRVRETGSFIWDCGHWQDGSDRSGADNIPGDPLGSAGVQSIAGEAAEIHPISELATWRSPKGLVPPGGRAAVPASQFDVYISNQGGGAKSVIECALAPASPANAVERAALEGGCSQLQDVTGRDYGYDVVAPPRPSRRAKLHWAEVRRTAHHAPAGDVRVLGDGIHVTVPFKSRHIAASSELQDFGASFYVWWSQSRPTHRFRVSFRKLTIYNNLDGDYGQPSRNDQNGNASVTPNGEWNLYVDIAAQWRALHTEMKAAGAGDLGNIPTKDTRKPYNLSRLRSTEVDLTDSGTLRVLTDARDCDLPGFTDCPAGNELAFSQRPGRGLLDIPVARLLGKTTTVNLTPVSCPASCDEDHSDPACHGPCYALSFSIQDVTALHGPAQIIAGDGTVAGTTVDDRAASSLGWWRDPPRLAGFDQDEEAQFIERAIAEYCARPR